jgi:hypothetical protein
MWKVAILVEGTWASAIPLEINQQPPSTQAIQGLVSNQTAPEYALLRRYLAEESELKSITSLMSGRRDAIELWSESVQGDAREFDWTGSHEIRGSEEGIALFSIDSESKDAEPTLTTLAWHDHTVVIVPIVKNAQQVTLEYTPNLRDENRIERLRYRYSSPVHQLETILDWRGYFGTQSAVVDGWATMRRRGNGFFASVRGTAGFLVGSVLRRLTRPQPTLERDPTAKRRLIAMSEAYPDVAAGYPDLAKVSPVDHDCAIVSVHGTVSCCIQNLKDLYPNVLLPVYRYEHDTFRPLQENGNELADLISSRLHTKSLLMVAHSRGGLVARFALDKLTRNAYSGHVQLYTFGTPHLGTPLAAMGGKALNMFFKLGEDFLGSIPVMTPLTKAYSYLVDSPKLPVGIDTMREDSEGLAILNEYGDPRHVTSWGSRFDVNAEPSGFGVAVEGVLMGALSGVPNDLVVPTYSALAFGAQSPVLSCSHCNYFKDPGVHGAIQSFCPPQGAPVIPVSGGRMENVVDYVVIGGIRIPVRNP